MSGISTLHNWRFMRFFHIEFTTYPETVDVFIRDRDETGTCIMCSSIDVSRYCNQPGYMTSILDDSIITSLILLASLHHVTSLILSVVEKPFNQPATIYGQMGIIIPLVGWVQSPLFQTAKQIIIGSIPILFSLQISRFPFGHGATPSSHLRFGFSSQ